MVLQLWPQSMGQLAVPQIWSRIHTFFHDTPTDFELANINDDLVGFFNSVPQDRLLDAINSLIQEWKSKHGEVALSVDMSQRGNPLQLSYVGKFHKAPRKTKVIQPHDILTIVQSSLQSHIFQAMNVIWHQVRGAGIGSHISPTISNLAVTLIERAWTQSYEEILTAPTFPFLAIRYVDNRYIIFPEEMIQDLSIQTLAQADFYQHPVELETVTTNELLGFFVDSKLRTIQYKLPEPWQIRDFASAGSLRLRLSGLQSRCHLISRYTYPRTGCPDRIHSLIHLYIAKGFQSSDCYKAIRKLNKKDTADFSLWEFVFSVFWPPCRCVWVTLCSKEHFCCFWFSSSSISLQAGDRSTVTSLLSTKTLVIRWWYWDWSSQRTCRLTFHWWSMLKQVLVWFLSSSTKLFASNPNFPWHDFQHCIHISIVSTGVSQLFSWLCTVTTLDRV